MLALTGIGPPIVKGTKAAPLADANGMLLVVPGAARPRVQHIALRDHLVVNEVGRREDGDAVNARPRRADADAERTRPQPQFAAIHASFDDAEGPAADLHAASRFQSLRGRERVNDLRDLRMPAEGVFDNVVRRGGELRVGLFGSRIAVAKRGVEPAGQLMVSAHKHVVLPHVARQRVGHKESARFAVGRVLVEEGPVEPGIDGRRAVRRAERRETGVRGVGRGDQVAVQVKDLEETAQIAGHQANQCGVRHDAGAGRLSLLPQSGQRCGGAVSVQGARRLVGDDQRRLMRRRRRNHRALQHPAAPLVRILSRPRRGVLNP